MYFSMIKGLLTIKILEFNFKIFNELANVPELLTNVNLFVSTVFLRKQNLLHISIVGTGYRLNSC